MSGGGGSRISTELTAAIWGGVAGAIVSGIFGVVTLLVGRWLRQRGGVQFTPPSHWQHFFIKWEGYGEHVTPSRVVYNGVSYQRLEPMESDAANYFVYAFTLDLYNKMDVGASLYDVSVVFMKNGSEMLCHRPFNEEETHDPSGILLDEAYRDVSADLGKEAKPPGEGIEPIGPISLPPHLPVTIKLRGYIAASHDPGFNYLKGGCDEVRLRGTRENAEPFDEHVESIATAPR